jgi:hypothetical protein
VVKKYLNHKTSTSSVQEDSKVNTRTQRKETIDLTFVTTSKFEIITKEVITGFKAVKNPQTKRPADQKTYFEKSPVICIFKD